MGLDLLDNPIRVTWDLQGDGFCMTDDVADRVLLRLLEAQAFFVTLEQAPLLHPRCRAILSGLTEAGVQVLLMSQGRRGELDRLDLIGTTPLTFLLDVQPFLSGVSTDWSGLKSAIETIRRAGIDPGLSMVPRKSNIAALPVLLDLCKDLKIPRFKLPNVRIDDSFHESGRNEILRSADLDELRRILPDLTSRLANLNLEIHDLFLWELLAPGSVDSRSEYGGCQAANSLAHITADGTVFPCVSWPLPLGSLLENSFAEIWASEPCDAVRRAIAARPSGCAGCSDYQLCFGGCRGLAATLEIEEGLDPMCRGPRVS